MGPISKFA